MNTIKNLHLLDGYLSSEQLERLDIGAQHYKRHGRIEFKVISFIPGKEITIRASQGKNPSGNYLTGKDLIVRAKDIFQRFFTDYQINVHPVEYIHSPVDIVNPKWIKDNMLKNSVSLKTLAVDTGIDKTSLSAVINGLKPLSQSMKGLFFYYFVFFEVVAGFKNYISRDCNSSLDLSWFKQFSESGENRGAFDFLKKSKIIT